MQDELFSGIAAGCSRKGGLLHYLPQCRKAKIFYYHNKTSFVGKHDKFCAPKYYFIIHFCRHIEWKQW